MDTTDTPRTGIARIYGVFVLGTFVVGIIGVAFRGSWGAFRDAALACHFDRDSAALYPFAVDGLMVVAIIALVMLRNDPRARRYCLGIIASYTGASLLINYLHGLGMFSPDSGTGVRPVPPWPVVLVVALLVVGSIFLGSHLLVYVWRHVFPEPTDNDAREEAYQGGTEAGDAGPTVPELPPPPFEAAKTAYRLSLAPQLKTLSQQDLVDQYRISKREAGRAQNEVKAELAADTAEATGNDAESAMVQHSPNGSGPEGA